MAKLIRVDRNGTKYYVDYKCPKCGGEGHIRGYEHIADGECFLCGGSGIHQTTWKEYTPEYAKKLEERRTARAIAKSEDKNAKFLERKGFSEDEAKYITERLKRSRQSDRDTVERIWSKGVVDEFEMRHYTKDYKSQETKGFLKERAQNYRWKKKCKEWLNYYSWQLTQL